MSNVAKQERVRVLGKVTLQGGRIVKRTGCALPRTAASGLAIRIASAIGNRETALAFAFRKAL